MTVNNDIADFFVHTVSVQTLLGVNAVGKVYAPAVNVTGFFDSELRLVRSHNGEEVVSSSSFYCSLADEPKFTTDSLVTSPSGVVSHVIRVNALDTAGMLEGVEHAVVFLK